jgi:hypothetical protein
MKPPLLSALIRLLHHPCNANVCRYCCEVFRPLWTWCRLDAIGRVCPCASVGVATAAMGHDGRLRLARVFFTRVIQQRPLQRPRLMPGARIAGPYSQKAASYGPQAVSGSGPRYWLRDGSGHSRPVRPAASPGIVRYALNSGIKADIGRGQRWAQNHSQMQQGGSAKRKPSEDAGYVFGAVAPQSPKG